MANIIQMGLRGMQFLWTLLIMALVGNMIHDATAGNPSIVNYCMFVAVFSMFCLIFLIAVAVNEDLSPIPLLPLGLDVLNVIFFLVGGIALAADLRVHSCGNLGYLKSNGVVNGSNNPGRRCHEAQAVCAFLWFGFATYAASMVMTGLGARGGGANLRGGIRRGGPAMSQV
ncbi:hypothetical protein MMC14_002698 [Varicellaria rhodocarpa]|nr:hypothetical protein [Varicellaria rhodocarpa]